MIGRRLGGLGMALAAGAAFFALATPAAQASPAAPATESSCLDPAPVGHDYTAPCGAGTMIFLFQRSYPTGPGGQGACYVFGRIYVLGQPIRLSDATVCVR
jgi:hypothetical protein